RARSSVVDLRTGPKQPRSTILSVEQEAIVVAFRRHTLLPLDDCLYALQPTIPHLTRSSLHRCLQRHGISRLPQVEGEASAKRKFKTYPKGYFHIDIAEVRTAEGKLHLIAAIDRTSKFAFVELHEKVTRKTAADFLRHLIAAVPYKVHTVLTDNGTHFTTPGNASSAAADIKAAIEAREIVWAHAFEYSVRHRPSAEQTQASMDERPSRAHEPDAQGCDRQTLPLRNSRSATKASRRLRYRIQLRPPAKDPKMAGALRIHLEALDKRATFLRPAELRAVAPDAVHDHRQASGRGDDGLL